METDEIDVRLLGRDDAAVSARWQRVSSIMPGALRSLCGKQDEELAVVYTYPLAETSD